MNYYEHHLGDYDGATAHLSWLEDCAYRRLLCLYYRSEAPLPGDVKQVCRLVRASTKPERDAVQQVLDEFFALEDDGWHNARCDEDIAEFHESEPDREAKRDNARERQRRSRERRRLLFEALRGHDIVPAWDSSTKQLEVLLSNAQSRAIAVAVTPPVTGPVTRDDTATQTPDPDPDPVPIPKLDERASPAPTRVADPVPTPAGAACLAVKAAGIGDVNPGHPKLLALLAAGVTPQELADNAAALVAKGKGKFALLLATVEGQRRDAAAAGAVPSAAVAQPAGDDWTTQRGVEAIAERLGLRPWDQTVAFPTYRAGVRCAAKAAEVTT